MSGCGPDEPRSDGDICDVWAPTFMRPLGAFEPAMGRAIDWEFGGPPESGTPPGPPGAARAAVIAAEERGS